MTARRSPAAARRAGSAAGAVAAILASALAAAAAGCAALPASGNVNHVSGSALGSGQSQAYPQLIAEPPGNGWTPAQIVSGFLVANASYAGKHAVARQYLYPPISAAWNPANKVTVLGQLEQPVSVNFNPHHISTVPTWREEVRGPISATVTASGQYVTTPGSYRHRFNLVKVGGQWRIRNPPSRLLLTSQAFRFAFQPRNLYFATPTGEALIPDPVFVPQDATNAALATQLVTALLDDPQAPWLQGAAQSAFPVSTRLIGKTVQINGSVATVNLTWPGSTSIGSQRLDHMAAQLVWTLTSPYYGTRSEFQSVVLEINGQRQDLDGAVVLALSDFSSWVPRASAGPGLYFADPAGAVRLLHGSQPTGRITAVPGQAGLGTHPLTRPAVSVSGRVRSVAGISAESARTIYEGRLASGARLLPRRLPRGGTAYSLSWDPLGDLWVAAGSTVWVLPQGHAAPAQVNISPLGRAKVTSLKVAPDGVRVALIERTGPSRSRLYLGAITNGGESAPHGALWSIGSLQPIGAGIGNARALSWYDSDHILVLTSAGRLFLVPLNGLKPDAVGPEPGITSIATDGTSLAAGRHGTIFMSSGLNQPWAPLGRETGDDPAYPG